MNFLVKTALFALLASAIVATPIRSNAQNQTTNKPSTDKKASTEKSTDKKSTSDSSSKKSRSLPFEGDIAAIDKVAKTIKVDSRTFEITSDTKIYKNDKPATMDDGTVGSYVTGSYRKSDEKLIARSIYFGGKGKGKDSDKSSSKTSTKSTDKK